MNHEDIVFLEQTIYSSSSGSEFQEVSTNCRFQLFKYVEKIKSWIVCKRFEIRDCVWRVNSFTAAAPQDSRCFPQIAPR